MKNNAKKIFSFLLVAVLQLSTCSVAFAADSSISKTGSDATTSSTTTTQAGNTVNWTLGYNNMSDGPVSAQVTDTIPTGTTYVPDSLQAPGGWAKQYSQDNQTSFGSVDTGTDTTDVRGIALLPNGGPGTGQNAPQPVSATQQSGTGYDAYMPIPYGDRVYGIVHHSTQPGKELVCSLRVGGDCPGYPMALNISGQEDIYTSINPMSYVDTFGRLFFAVQRTTGFGVFCFDLPSDTNCSTPYTEWSSTGGVLGAEQPSRILGVVQVGGCLYGWDTNLVVHALDLSDFSTTCNGINTADLASGYSLPTYDPSTHTFSPINYGPVGSAQVIGGKVYFVENYSFNDGINIFCGFSSTNYCENSRLVCFDPLAVSGVCSSWVPPSLGGANTPAMLATTVLEDKSTNNPCTIMVDATPGTYGSNLACFDATDGSSATAPSNMQSNVINDARVLSGEAGSSIYLMAAYEEVTTTLTNGHEVTILPFTKFSDSLGNSIRGGAGCYDWNTNDECAGWGSSGDGETSWTTWGSSDAVNAGDTRDYGYAIDDAGCLLGLGDAGWLWSFNADDGSVPCRRSTSTSEIDPAGYYCDGQAGHVTGWDKVTVSNVNLGDFTSMLVTIRDGNGVIVGSYNEQDILPGSGVLDISSIPYSGDTIDLSVTVSLIAQNDNPWTGGSLPFVAVTFTGDDAQICFQTISSTSCDILTILNQADEETTMLSDSSVHTSSASHSLAVDHGTSCPTTPASSPSNGSTNGAGAAAPLAKTGTPAVPLALAVGTGIISLAVRVSRRRGRPYYVNR